MVHHPDECRFMTQTAHPTYPSAPLAYQRACVHAETVTEMPDLFRRQSRVAAEESVGFWPAIVLQLGAGRSVGTICFGRAAS